MDKLFKTWDHTTRARKEIFGPMRSVKVLCIQARLSVCLSTLRFPKRLWGFFWFLHEVRSPIFEKLVCAKITIHILFVLCRSVEFRGVAKTTYCVYIIVFLEIFPLKVGSSEFLDVPYEKCFEMFQFAKLSNKNRKKNNSIFSNKPG